MNNVPNLDNMSQSDLRSFWSETSRASCSVRRAQSIVGDCKNPRLICSLLASYAITKCAAMASREAGETQGAVAYEEHLDVLFEQLPESVRW